MRRAGVIVGGAVPPMACALTWTRCTRLAAIISAAPAHTASWDAGAGKSPAWCMPGYPASVPGSKLTALPRPLDPGAGCVAIVTCLTVCRPCSLHISCVPTEALACCCPMPCRRLPSLRPIGTG